MNGKFIINVKTILAFWAQLDTPDGMFYISIGHIFYVFIWKEAVRQGSEKKKRITK